jgi:biotin carboxyl carrier protein
MRMETTIYAERTGRVAVMLAVVGRQVKAGELLRKMSPEK